MSDTNKPDGKETRVREWWIHKGSSDFCADLQWEWETDTYKKHQPDGFYDLVLEKDTVEGAIHVIEHSAYLAVCKERDEYRMAASAEADMCDALKAENDKLSENLFISNKAALERDALKAKLAVAREALETQRACGNCGGCRDMAAKALEQIGE